MVAKNPILSGLIVCGAAAVAMSAEATRANLPDAVSRAIGRWFPGAVIQTARAQAEGLKVFELQLQQDTLEVNVTATPDGTILDVETALAPGAVPEPIRAALAQQTVRPEDIKQVKSETIYYEIVLKKLEIPKTAYEARVVQDGNQVNLNLDVTGAILAREVQGPEPPPQADAHDPDPIGPTDHEILLHIQQVPWAVRTTIDRYAQGGRIQRIALKIQEGRIVFEVEVLTAGRVSDLQIALNGELLQRRVQPADRDTN